MTRRNLGEKRNMGEIINRTSDQALDPALLTRISTILDKGGLIVYPASNLYGLGAAISSEIGLERLTATKKRPRGMAISIMASKHQIEELCQINELANYFLNQGSKSITAVLNASESAPETIVHNGTVAVRYPCSELTRSLVEAVGPLTATSANIHGQDAPLKIEDAERQLGDQVSLYINGGSLGGTPTTLVDLTGHRPKVLREGLMPASEVYDIYGR